jgi:hypothetical protein
MPKRPFIVLATVLMALGCLMLGAGIIYRFLLPRFYKATARIKVEKDHSEIISPGRDAAVPAGAFDPYWVQTEFERIQSKMILYPGHIQSGSQPQVGGEAENRLKDRGHLRNAEAPTRYPPVTQQQLG